LSFGIFHDKNVYALSKEKNLHKNFETNVVNHKLFFDSVFQSNNVIERNKLPRSTYLEIWNQERKNIRIYGPLDFFDYSDEIREFVTIEGKMPQKQWSIILDCLVDLGIYENKIDPKDYINNIETLEIKKLTDSFMTKLEDETEVEDFLDFYQKSEEEPEIREMIKESFMKAVNEFSLKSKGYNLKSNKLLDNLLRKMDVAPGSLPPEIREIYVTKSYDIYMQGKSEEFCYDFQGLVESYYNESVLANFLKKWGRESIAFSIKMAKEKEIDALVPFDYMFDDSLINYYKNSLFTLLETLDYVFDYCFSEITNTLNIMNHPINKIIKLNKYGYNRMNLRLLFRRSLNNAYEDNMKNLSSLYMFNIIDAIFLNDESLSLFKSEIQIPTDGDEKSLIKPKQYDPILNKLLVTKETRYIVKEFISSFLRIYGNGFSDQSNESINRQFRDYQLQSKIPDNWLFNVNLLARNQTNHTKFDIVDTKISDNTKHFIKQMKEMSDGECDLIMVDSKNPFLLHKVERPDEDDDSFEEFMSLVYDPEYEEDIEGLNYTHFNLRKSNLKYQDTQQELIKVNLISVQNFKISNLPYIFYPGEITILETNTLLEVDFYMKTNYCKIGYRKPINRKKDIEGLNILYVFGDFDKPINQTLDKLNIVILNIDHNDYKSILSYEQAYKKINGRYVEMNKDIMMSTLSFLSKNKTSTEKAEEMTKFSALMDKYDLSSLNNAQMEEILNECNNVPKCHLLLSNLKNTQLDEDFKKYICYLLGKPNDIINWKTEFKKYYPKKEWSENPVVDFFSMIKLSLTTLDYNALMLRKNRENVIHVLENKFKDLEKFNENVHLGKVNFNVFGYSSNIYNEIKYILGEDMNHILESKLFLSSSCAKSLKAFLSILEQNIGILNEKQDECYLENDLYLYNFLKGLESITVIDNAKKNDEFRSFLINSMENYIIDRNSYIMTKYPRRPIKRNKKENEDISYLDKFKRFFTGV